MEEKSLIISVIRNSDKEEQKGDFKSDFKARFYSLREIVIDQ